MARSGNLEETAGMLGNLSGSEMLLDDEASHQGDMEWSGTLEYRMYHQLKTWNDNKISNKDLEGLDGNYLECKVEFDEKRNAEIQTKGREGGGEKGGEEERGFLKKSNLNPLMFSFTKGDISVLRRKEEEPPLLGDLNSTAQGARSSQLHLAPSGDADSKVRSSVENLLKLNEVLKMNLESETPTVVSSSETQLELDQSNWDELFRSSGDNHEDHHHFSKIDLLEKLTDQITSSIKSLIMGEALLGADNARQVLLFELKSLQKWFRDKQEKVAKSIEDLIAQTSSDEDISMLVFKIDQIRSALRHFNLSSRFEGFNFGYGSSPNIETEDVERILHSSQTSNFLAKHKLFKINRWHRQLSSSFEKSTNNVTTPENSPNCQHHLFHHDGQHHHNILSHYKHHQQRCCYYCNNEKNGDPAKKDYGTSSWEKDTPQVLPASPLVNNDGWNVEYSKGVSLSYKIDSSQNGQLSINVVIKSEINCKLLNLLTILNEVELSNMWVPYMSYSKCFYNFSRVSKLVQQIYDLPWPIGQRENIMFCFGVDTLREHDCIMISCGDPQSSSNQFFGVKIPDPPPKVPREKCSYLLFILTPSEHDKDFTTLEMFSSFCVTKYVPIKLTSFLIKRMTKKMYVDIASLASNLSGSPYEAAYNSNLQLYSWLDMKLSQYYELKQRKSY